MRRRRAWVQIAATTLSGNSLRQTVHTARSVRLFVRLSVPRRSCLGYRHAGCLHLSHRRSPEMCGQRILPRTDVDPPRFLPPSNCHPRGHIVSQPRGDTCIVVPVSNNYRVGQKSGDTDSWPQFCQIYTDLKRFFTGRFLGKFVVRMGIKPARFVQLSR